MNGKGNKEKNNDVRKGTKEEGRRRKIIGE